MFVLYMSLLDSPDDQRKFEQLYITYRQTMFYVANNILNDTYEAEDAVHQALLRIIDHLDDIDENDKNKTKSYLSIVTQNIAIDIYRKKRRERKRSISFDEYAIYIEDPVGQEFENIKEEDNRLAEAIKKLPPHYAEVIRLTYGHGYDSEKVGEILNLTPDNVRQRLVRARRKLAKLLGGEYKDFC